MRFMVLMTAIAFAGSATAAELPNSEAAKHLAEQVMSQVATGDLRGGLEIAKPYTIVPAAEFESMVGQAELQMPLMLSRFGKSKGYEVIRTDAVGESLIQVLALQRFEKHPTVWRFIFYRGDNGWLLDSFKFSDDPSIAF